MKRYPAFDPPEYLEWAPDPDLIDQFEQTLASDHQRAEVVNPLSEHDLLSLYRDLLRTRLHDIGLKRWVRTGVISKAWLGTGEEAVTVGNVRALDPDRDVVSPMIRNAGALHMMGMPLSDMFRGYLATSDSPSEGTICSARSSKGGGPAQGVTRIQPPGALKRTSTSAFCS